MKYDLRTGKDFSKSLLNLINAELPLMVDTETVGLYGKIRLAQFYQPHFLAPVLIENPDIYELMGMLDPLHSVMHNASYDVSTIQNQAERMPWFPKKLDDTLYLSRLQFPAEEKFSLDHCIHHAINHNPYGEGKAELQKSGWDAPVLSEEQLVYAATDVYYLQQLYDVVKSHKDNLNYKLDMLTLENNFKMQCNGIPLNLEALQEKYSANQQRIDEIKLPINCNSYQQVRKYINSVESDDLGLAKQSAQGNKRAIDVRETRKLTKQNSFLSTYAKQSTDDGKIYGFFKPSARSGRSTCDHENLQQIPRKVRDIFSVDEDGDTIFLYSDFSQLELRCVTAVTAERNMEQIYRDGGDIHHYTATRLFHTQEPTKEQRQIGKTCNFALLYGAGWKVLQSILLKTTGIYLKEAECKDIRNRWLNLFPSLKAWHTQGIRDWKAGRLWRTPMGRQYVGKLMTDQVNIQIQGMGAEVAKLANHYMDKVMKGLAKIDPMFKDWAQWQVNFLHDAYLYRLPNNPVIYEQVAEIVADAMQLAWKEISSACKIPDLPMPVKVLVGSNWGDLEEGTCKWEHKQ